MRELVCENTAQLLGRHVVEQALRDRDDRVLGVPAGRERVRLLGGNEVDPRLRHPCDLGELGNHAMQLGRVRLADRLRPAGLDRELVGHPVGREVHDHREDDEDPEEGSSERSPDPDEEAGQPGEQEPGPGLGRGVRTCDAHGA